MKEVSVIIPIYNTAEYLKTCIESIMNQTYRHLEIIMINDASTDNSKEIVNQFLRKDSRITLLENAVRRGVGASRNIGIKHASGDYLYFVDSDDILHQDAIKLLVDNIGEDYIISGSALPIKSSEDMEKLKYTDETSVKIRKIENVFVNRSVLKGLYDRQYVEENNIKFLENTTFYTEYSFMYKFFMNHDMIKHLKDSRYFKRKRKDLVKNPALRDMGADKKIINYLRMYSTVDSMFTRNKRVKRLIDKDFLNYFRKHIFISIRETNQFHNVFHELSKAMNKVNPEHYKDQNFIVKKEIKAINKKDEKLFKRFFKLHHNLRDLKNAMKSKRHFILFLYRNIFLKIPIKENHIIFESFLGKNYSDNPKAIYKYLLQYNKEDYKFIWIYADNKLKIPGNPKQVRRFSLKYYYYMAISKYWILNTRASKHIIKRKETVYLQTWHGTPLKKLGMDIEQVQMPGTDTGRYKKNFTDEANRWDYLISPNPYSSEIFRRAFLFKGTMLEYGYPRNDILYHENKEDKARAIKKRLNIPVDKKVILYAPTWRDNQFYEKGKYRFELDLDLDKMRRAISDEYVIVLRLHYVVASQLDVSPYEGFAYDLSSYDDIAELYIISDLLITDYSSVFFDYANLKRPILFYTYDLDDYRDNIRGLYFDIESGVPGPLLKTTDQVIDAIKDINKIEEQYAGKYNVFYKKFCTWEDNRASEKVVKEVLN
ncbi:CDP-glycerol:glycerophosphate glycerophosphotransferase [Virgibacillus sp. MSP4-1]|uniref:bifunctional glycosyltransferase/CDP-glycerol:glycerophosphate glycerophosphotransferase n=1 Tax=Virgibacillus sp. MSP4-1 TaxID=2700081 RepID=UPI0003A82584|nr:CDP-glycerol:glycerophosphate glycerophosphotransferase [Virgibacillus sp. MSP4-1]QHS23522.1 CDP-glycerol:glycerophosphate glycerophosphotransferase [Virgibacillus sp. MSP4-1]